MYVRRLLTVGAIALTALASVGLTRSRQPEPMRFCAAYGDIPTHQVIVDGQRYVLGAIGTDGCNHAIAPMVNGRCEVFDIGMSAHRIGTFSPFFTDGTCDGSKGGTQKPDAPVVLPAK